MDRDSELVAFDLDERDPGVKTMLRVVVEARNRAGRHAELCGRAPSDYPGNGGVLGAARYRPDQPEPDALLKTTEVVLEAEQRAGRRARQGTLEEVLVRVAR
jgi:pyruvate, water dikinase